ncbi:type II toxin-antitoxin system RelE/ParE family toxin [Nanoarchaeota archaeon]
MNYEIIWDTQPREFLRKIDKKDSQRIIKKINHIAESPFRYVEKLIGMKGYKLRIGDFRSFLDIEQKQIIVLFLGHRKNIYKQRRF